MLDLTDCDATSVSQWRTTAPRLKTIPKIVLFCAQIIYFPITFPRHSLKTFAAPQGLGCRGTPVENHCIIEIKMSLESAPVIDLQVNVHIINVFQCFVSAPVM